jgi:hypothetical protein
MLSLIGGWVKGPFAPPCARLGSTQIPRRADFSKSAPCQNPVHHGPGTLVSVPGVQSEEGSGVGEVSRELAGGGVRHDATEG